MAAETEFSRCLSKNQKMFTAEIALHFAGVEGLNKPIVWMFPTLSICLDCGKAQFTVPETELEVLRTEASVEGAAVWLGGREQQ